MAPHLRVRTADLDDVLELLCLGVQRLVQLLQAGQRDVVQLQHGGDVHRRRERVVGRLPPTDGHNGARQPGQPNTSDHR